MAGALVVEFLDELVDGSRGAALPLMRHDLGLTYAQVGLLVAVPLVVGSLIELPLGILAGYGARRRRAVRWGGIFFVAALIAVATAGSFVALLLAWVAFFPASGAFVSLTQAELMDASGPGRDRHLAAWTLAGSIGALAGAPLVVAVLAVGGSWRHAFVIAAAATALAMVGAGSSGPPPDVPATPAQPRSTLADIRAAVRARVVVRWLVLLEVSDLMLDALTGFLALYLVDVAHTSPAWAATAIAVRLTAGLAGEAALIPLLARVRGRSVLIASAMIAAIGYPAFLLVPGIALKLTLLSALSMATAPWYPLLTAELYSSLEGHSGVAVTLSSASALVGAIGPLALGLIAQHFGLATALAGLTLAPLLLLVGLIGRTVESR